MSTVEIGQEELNELLWQMTQLQVRAAGIRTVMESRDENRDVTIALSDVHRAFAVIQMHFERLLEATAPV